jgi:hypothetical protein
MNPSESQPNCRNRFSLNSAASKALGVALLNSEASQCDGLKSMNVATNYSGRKLDAFAHREQYLYKVNP